MDNFVIEGTLLLILSVVSPLIISFLTKSSMSFKTKQLIAFGISLVIGLVIAFMNGLVPLTTGAGPEEFLNGLAIGLTAAYTISQAIYAFIFKNTEFDRKVKNDLGVHDKEPLEVESR